MFTCYVGQVLKFLKKMSVLFLQLRWRVSAARLLVIAPQTVRALMRRAPHLDATHFVLLYLQRASVRGEEGHRKGGKANSELAIKIFNCNLISWCADMESLTISSGVSLQLSLSSSLSLFYMLFHSLFPYSAFKRSQRLSKSAREQSQFNTFTTPLKMLIF